MFELASKGNYAKTESWLKRLASAQLYAQLDRLGKRGVQALSSATPVNTGLTAESWSYEIVKENGSVTINWMNSHKPNGFPVAVMLQHGHGTGTGGYVQGQDYINPAIKPVMDQISSELRKALKS